jgi:hypothetical protein
MSGYIGDPMSELHLGVYTDADHAGDKTDRVSTSGIMVIIMGPNTWFPINAISSKQTCQSHSTPESEIVALDKGVKDEAIPLLNLLDIILKRKVKCICWEDNEATIKIVDKGYSAALRHISRIHGVDIGFLHRCYHQEPLCSQFSLQCCRSADMAADVLTKHITEESKWSEALRMLNLAVF